jgi:hypothetical protein
VLAKVSKVPMGTSSQNADDIENTDGKVGVPKVRITPQQ